MNKAELVIEIQKRMGEGASKAASLRALDAVLESIKRGISKDKKVKLHGFGTFASARRAARIGVNPQTGEPIKIKSFKTVTFKPGDDLKLYL